MITMMMMMLRRNKNLLWIAAIAVIATTTSLGVHGRTAAFVTSFRSSSEHTSTRTRRTPPTVFLSKSQTTALSAVSSVRALSWNSTDATATTTTKSNFDYSNNEQQAVLQVPLLPRRLWARLEHKQHTVDAADATGAVEVDTPNTPEFRVYCDLDGVLCDFAHGISQLFDDVPDNDDEIAWSQQNIDAIKAQGQLWDRVHQADSFFEHLPWCPGGRELWQALAPLQPNVLTGVPSYCDTAPRIEKFAWCQRELVSTTSTHDAVDSAVVPTPTKFHHVDKAGRFRRHYPVKYEARASSSSSTKPEWHCTVITCWSERKHHESGPGVVLIDDRLDLKEAWEAKGGIFIHHITGDVAHTLRQLREHGILPALSSSPEIGQPDEETANNVLLKERMRLWQQTDLRP